MPARMTSTAWRQGFTNAFLCTFSLMAVVALGGWLLSRVTAWPPLTSVMVAFGVFFVASQVAFFATLMRDRRARGRLLLDCGPHPTWWLFAGEGLLLLVMPVAFAGAGALKPTLSPALPAAAAVSGLFFLVLATGRLQVREHGIWQYWGLLRWERLASYRWANDATLVIRGRGPFQFLRGALPVPPEHQAEVKALLTKYAPSDQLA